jgi:hypothetical protein
MPEPINDWSLTSLKEKLIKIGAKVVSHGRYVAFQMAEVAIPRQMFQEVLRLIGELRPQPPPRQHEMPMLMRSPSNDGRSASKCNDKISPSIAVRTARGEGSRPRHPPVLPERWKSAKMQAGSGFIWRISVWNDRSNKKPRWPRTTTVEGTWGAATALLGRFAATSGSRATKDASRFVLYCELLISCTKRITAAQNG